MEEHTKIEILQMLELLEQIDKLNKEVIEFTRIPGVEAFISEHHREFNGLHGTPEYIYQIIGHDIYMIRKVMDMPLTDFYGRENE